MDPSNPYQPPNTTPALAVSSRRFVCTKCDTSLPFIRIWLMQPIGRCPYCRTRLVVRRHGWNKVWTPILMGLCFWSCFLLAVIIGVQALFFVPLLLLVLATIDGSIAYRIGYFDQAKWIF